MSTQPEAAPLITTALGCTCAEYQRRVKAYRIPLPCSHMLAVLAALPVSQNAPPTARAWTRSRTTRTPMT